MPVGGYCDVRLHSECVRAGIGDAVAMCRKRNAIGRIWGESGRYRSRQNDVLESSRLPYINQPEHHRSGHTALVFRGIVSSSQTNKSHTSFVARMSRFRVPYSFKKNVILRFEPSVQQGGTGSFPSDGASQRCPVANSPATRIHESYVWHGGRRYEMNPQGAIVELATPTATQADAITVFRETPYIGCQLRRNFHRGGRTSLAESSVVKCSQRSVGILRLLCSRRMVYTENEMGTDLWQQAIMKRTVTIGVLAKHPRGEKRKTNQTHDQSLETAHCDNVTHRFLDGLIMST